MDERETITIDKELYDELTNSYYAKKNSDTPSWTDFLIVLLIGAIAVLGVFCYQQNNRIEKLENEMEQVINVFQETSDFFSELNYIIKPEIGVGSTYEDAERNAKPIN